MRARRRIVLVTGGAGYVGSHTCKALAQAGYTPVTYDNLMHGHAWAVKWGPMVHGDLADGDLLKDTLRRHSIDAVIHFAGYAYVGESMSDPGKYFRNNVANTITMLEAMVSAGVGKIVLSSTCAIYGTPAEVPIREDSPQMPINPYGESKLVVERMLPWWKHAHGVRSAALRYFNAAGADPDGEIGEHHEPETHLIPLAIEAALGQRPALDIYGTDYPTRDGTAVRDYVHVSDLASAHVSALQHLQSGGESIGLNLGTGVGHSVREVVDVVEEVSGSRVPVRAAPRRAGDPAELVAGAQRACDVLRWQPRSSSLRSIVQTAWRWHSELKAQITRVPTAGAPAAGKKRSLL